MKNYQPRTIWLTLMVIVALLIQYKLPGLTLETGLIKKWLGMEYSEKENIPMKKVDLLGDLRIDPQRLEDDKTDSTLLAQLNAAQQMTVAPQNAVPADSSATGTDSVKAPETAQIPSSFVVIDSAKGKENQLLAGFRDTTPRTEGIVEIIDYGTESNLGMDRFYAALEHVKERPVRIAFFGDSFIEGDILTGWLRNLMQQEWGGKGVGYIEIAPETAGFRTTVTHRHHGWDLHKWLNKKTFQKQNQGLSCHYYTTKSKAWMEGTSVKRYSQNFNQTNFYFLPRQKDKIKLVTNDTTIFFDCDKSDTLKTLTYNSTNPLQKARWSLENEGSESIFFGMSMDGNTGISIDNLSMRGQSGTQLLSVPQTHLQAMHKVRKYDLIVLQFGLNVASTQGTNFSHYQHEMERVVNYLHQAYPEAGFLILSVGDRRYKNNGNLVTMPGVKNLSLYQHNVAVQTKIAYWNMLDAMLQLGGIDSMAKAKPTLANQDYTHINFRGGQLMAEKLFEAIKSGRGRYERKEAYINEKRKEMSNETK